MITLEYLDKVKRMKKHRIVGIVFGGIILTIGGVVGITNFIGAFFFILGLSILLPNIFSLTHLCRKIKKMEIDIEKQQYRD